MDRQIKVTYRNEEEGTAVILNKLGTEQKLLELLETKDVTSIDIIYKKREPAVECQLS